MLRIAAPTRTVPLHGLAARGPARGDFAALLSDGAEARGAAAAGGVIGSGALLAIQGQAGQDPPPRRRRPPRDVAAQGLEMLRDLQRGLLGLAAIPLERMADLAAEAELEARDGGEGARFCAPIALRLRVELAKREARGAA
ncbi:flagellar assembly protein FliX [Falsiroseomonas selenitidurans]|uniref:Uncharacterized protein n=1 Tax=Falsiroseomonas selenitidurans TaxID=2716335 RepID=A0ABX1DX75_9PROT|nr:flagellar assembly protein FliX [Falsiroseomonas selenitidurans]NKC29484.1 hypothetical protein [Falsiroseomonas selenitidurans]